MAYELNGVSYEADEEGYLVDLSAWNKELAELIAQDENIEMNDDAWEVVNFPAQLLRRISNCSGSSRSDQGYKENTGSRKG